MTPRRHPCFQRRIPTSRCWIASHGLNPPSRTRSRALKKRPLPSTQNGCFPCAGEVRVHVAVPRHVVHRVPRRRPRVEKFTEMFVLCSTS